MSSVDVDPVLFAKAMADETRQEMLKRLCCVWLSVNDLVEQLNYQLKQYESWHSSAARIAGLSPDSDLGRAMKTHVASLDLAITSVKAALEIGEGR